MIGSRVAAAAAVLALVVVLDGGAPRPEVALAANAAIVDAADRSLAAIDRLEAMLAPGLDAARAGAARVVAGEADPAEPLVAAAEDLRAAGPAATAVGEAVADLERARAALRSDAEPLVDAPSAAGLGSIATQLDEAADAGAAFAAVRRDVEGVSVSLVDALDAIADGEVDDGRARLVAASAAVDVLRDWEDDAITLSVWVDTADAMIRAMQRLVDAVAASDADEAEAARADFDAAAADAPEADRALRIGIGEAGSALTSVPLTRLARELATLRDLEAAVRAARAEAAG